MKGYHEIISLFVKNERCGLNGIDRDHRRPLHYGEYIFK